MLDYALLGQLLGVGAGFLDILDLLFCGVEGAVHRVTVEDRVEVIGG